MKHIYERLLKVSCTQTDWDCNCLIPSILAVHVMRKSDVECQNKTKKKNEGPMVDVDYRMSRNCLLYCHFCTHSLWLKFQIHIYFCVPIRWRCFIVTDTEIKYCTLLLALNTFVYATSADNTYIYILICNNRLIW